VTPTVRLPALVIWLTLVWAFLWGDFGLASLVAGVAVALFIVWIGRPADVHGVQLTSFHPLSALVFLGYFSVQLVKSNLQVAWTVISPRPDVHTALVAVPMHVASEGIVTVVANAVTLTPGTLTVDVHEPDDGTPAVIYVHVLQFEDVESVRADVLQLERRAVRAFGTKQQRHDLDEVVAARAARSDGAS
jgi:multicomponent Na+:H+ antiporter subunit E